MPALHSKAFHIVLSPKECLLVSPLLQWLSSEKCRYVVAYEFGENGHKHIDCYVVFDIERRQDHVRRSMFRKYPNIPKSEHINVKVVVNQVDPDERYGFGYALKEGNEIHTNLEMKEQIASLEYYRSNSERVKELLNVIRLDRDKGKPWTVDKVVQGMVGYATDFFTASDHDKFYSDCHSFLIEQYMSILIKAKVLPFTVYQRIRRESLHSYLINALGKPSEDHRFLTGGLTKCNLV